MKLAWSVDAEGVATAEAGGIRFELLPCPEALFDLGHCKGTAEHLARLQAHGQGWADGAVCRMAYRGNPPEPERPPPAKRRITR